MTVRVSIQTGGSTLWPKASVPTAELRLWRRAGQKGRNLTRVERQSKRVATQKQAHFILLLPAQKHLSHWLI